MALNAFGPGYRSFDLNYSSKDLPLAHLLSILHPSDLHIRQWSDPRNSSKRKDETVTGGLMDRKHLGKTITNEILFIYFHIHSCLSYAHRLKLHKPGYKGHTLKL